MVRFSGDTHDSCRAPSDLLPVPGDVSIYGASFLVGSVGFSEQPLTEFLERLFRNRSKFDVPEAKFTFNEDIMQRKTIFPLDGVLLDFRRDECGEITSDALILAVS